MSNDDKKYGALAVTIKQGQGSSATKGVFLNNDLYITARQDGNKVRLFFIGTKDKYLLRRLSKNSDVEHVNDDLLDEVEIHEHQFRERQARVKKENSTFKKKP